MRCDAPWLRGAPSSALARAGGRKRFRSPVTGYGALREGEPGPSVPRVDGRDARPRPRWCLPRRRWVESDALGDNATSSGADAFLLMTYNILGDNNAFNHRDLYVNVPLDTLKWNSRRRLILREISHWNPDIVCLQEVDRFQDIMFDLNRKGYAGKFLGRSGDAMDGCATFWVNERFHLLQEDYIDFSAYNLRNNVAQLLVFEFNGGRRVVVGNIHVLFNPRRGDIKLGQIRILLNKAKILSKKWGDIPVVLAGDFNSTPGSAIYEFISSTKLNVTLHDRKYLSGMDASNICLLEFPRLLEGEWSKEELKNAVGNSKSTMAEHPLELQSAYASVKGNTKARGPQGEPLATSFHSKFLGTVDYIWYDGLLCSRVLETLHIDILRKTGGLPTKEMGSDHVALVGEFIFPESVELKEKGDSKHSGTSESDEDASL